LRGSIRKGAEKVASSTSLELRAAWCTLRAGRLPSDKAMIRRTAGDWSSLDELIKHLCLKTSPVFLFTANHKKEYLELFEEQYSPNIDETLKMADAICQHRFQFLGQDFEFPNEIDWHLDPVSGDVWRKDYFEKIDQWMWSGKRLGDYKLPWELNRHQYFVTLGKAYWLSGNDRYPEEYAHQILSWIRQNPVGIGINWYSALEIGVRLISWVIAFYFIRGSSYFVTKAGKPFLKSLYQQASFLRNHLTANEEFSNNHIIGEAAALVIVGSLFPELKEAREWLRTGLQIFEEQINLQTFTDGANKEQATSYHRFVLEFLLLIVILGRRGAFDVSLGLETHLEKMLDYLMYIMTPEGNVPMIGDSDDGRGYIFDESADVQDVRNWLAVGAVLFNRPEFKFVAQEFGEGAFWLLGLRGLRAFEQLEGAEPKETSVSFPNAGHYVIRDNWTGISDYAFFKCGPFGYGGDGFCAHSHCDQLGFVLWIEGTPIVLDSGTYTYHGASRDIFRLTTAHNTLMVDEHEQAMPLNEFAWQGVTQTKCMSWEDNWVVGAIEAAPGVWHRRELHHPAVGIWEINDDLEAKGGHKVSWFFHLAPDLSVSRSATFEHLVLKIDGSLHVILVPPSGVQLDIRTGWYSSSYGRKEPNPLLVASWCGEIPLAGIRFSWRFKQVDKEDRKD